jgi:hypothetical protein
VQALSSLSGAIAQYSTEHPLSGDGAGTPGEFSGDQATIKADSGVDTMVMPMPERSVSPHTPLVFLPLDPIREATNELSDYTNAMSVTSRIDSEPLGPR